MSLDTAGAADPRTDRADVDAALRKRNGQTVVVKLGGHAMTDAGLIAAFAEDVVRLADAGVGVVVVHGGGPHISAELDRRGISSEFRAGLRVTTPEVLAVVRTVLRDRVNRQVVAAINALRPIAVACDGEGTGLLIARQHRPLVNGTVADIGQVGEVVAVNTTPVDAALAAGRIPVITSVAGGADGQIYNVNADTAAAELAVALSADELLLLTDVAGLYRDWPNRESLVSAVTAGELRPLLPALSAGMVPKMSACLRAVDGGVPSARVFDGRQPHRVLAILAGDAAGGTLVRPDPELPSVRRSDVGRPA